jgi:16S rRNA (adenine1518-N6/adenine1519-N6)-dimethyltransferase
MLAEVGSKERGALSVLIQARFKVKNELTLRPTAFFPPPKVVSNVVSLTSLEKSFFRDRTHEKQFDRVVKASFSGRLKTIRNSLVMGKLGSTEDIESLLRRAGIDPAIRPIHLPVTDYLSLADAIESR